MNFHLKILEWVPVIPNPNLSTFNIEVLVIPSQWRNNNLRGKHGSAPIAHILNRMIRFVGFQDVHWEHMAAMIVDKLELQVCENIRLYIEKYEEFQECLNDFALAFFRRDMEGKTMRVMFESWFVEYKVDVVFAGHVHAYERSERVSNIAYNIINGMCAPVKDQFAPIYITIGDGENIEGLAINMIVPQPNYSAY
ncbi:hypothetical protein AAG906_003614 [Vitis piasezkii]